MKSQGNERKRNEWKEEASEIGEEVGQERGRRVQEESGRGPRPAVIYRWITAPGVLMSSALHALIPGARRSVLF